MMLHIAHRWVDFVEFRSHANSNLEPEVPASCRQPDIVQDVEWNTEIRAATYKVARARSRKICQYHEDVNRFGGKRGTPQYKRTASCYGESFHLGDPILNIKHVKSAL